jgi:hypothetical protein
MGMCFIDWEPSVAQPQFVLLPNQRWQDLWWDFFCIVLIFFIIIILRYHVN